MKFFKFASHLLEKQGHSGSRAVQRIKNNTAKPQYSDKCIELFETWISNTEDPTWGQVIEALKKSDFRKPAGDLQTALMKSSEQPQQEQKPNAQGIFLHGQLTSCMHICICLAQFLNLRCAICD